MIRAVSRRPRDRHQRAGRRTRASSRCSTPEPTTTWSSPSRPTSSRRGSAPCCAAPHPDRAGRPARGRRPRASTCGPGTRRLDGAALDLSPKEFDLLAYLAEHAGRGRQPSASCSRRSGTSRTAAPTRPSTSTCTGCGASSARAPTRPGLPAPGPRRRREAGAARREAPAGPLRPGDDLRGPGRVPRAARSARPLAGRGARPGRGPPGRPVASRCSPGRRGRRRGCGPSCSRSTRHRAHHDRLPPGRQRARVPRRDAPTSVALAALGRALTARTTAGAEVLVPVGGPDGVAVVRTAVPRAELTARRGAGLARRSRSSALVLLAGTAFAGRPDRRPARPGPCGTWPASPSASAPGDLERPGGAVRTAGGRVGGRGAQRPRRPGRRPARRRARAGRRPLAPAAHPDHRARGSTSTRSPTRPSASGWPSTSTDLVAAVDAVIRTARQHERRTPPAATRPRSCATAPGSGAVLATDQGRAMQMGVPDGPGPGRGRRRQPRRGAGRAGRQRLPAHPRRHRLPAGRPPPRSRRRVVAVSDDGPGLADATLAERGRSGAGSTGLGLDVARRTAERVGGQLEVGDRRPVVEVPGSPWSCRP